MTLINHGMSFSLTYGGVKVPAFKEKTDGYTPVYYENTTYYANVRGIAHKIGLTAGLAHQRALRCDLERFLQEELGYCFTKSIAQYSSLLSEAIASRIDSVVQQILRARNHSLNSGRQIHTPHFSLQVDSRGLTLVTLPTRAKGQSLTFHYNGDDAGKLQEFVPTQAVKQCAQEMYDKVSKISPITQDDLVTLWSHIHRHLPVMAAQSVRDQVATSNRESLRTFHVLPDGKIIISLSRTRRAGDRVIEKGTQSRVTFAWLQDCSGGQVVAGAHLRINDKIVTQLENSEKILERIRGAPNLIQLLAGFRYNGKGDGLKEVFLYEYYPERDMIEVLQKEQLTDPRCAGITLSVLTALDSLEKRGIVHRDIKPDNILINGRDATLTDFGFACIPGESKDLKDFCCSLNYISPEYAHAFINKLSVESVTTFMQDVWAAGLSIMTACTRSTAFPWRDDLRIMQQITDHYLDRWIDCKISQPIFNRLVKRMLRIKPEDRISAAAALREFGPALRVLMG